MIVCSCWMQLNTIKIEPKPLLSRLQHFYLERKNMWTMCYTDCGVNSSNGALCGLPNVGGGHLKLRALDFQCSRKSGTILKTNPVSVSCFWTNCCLWLTSLSDTVLYWEQEPGPWWKRVPGGRSTDWSREAGRNFALPGAETGVGSWRQGVGGSGTEQIRTSHGFRGFRGFRGVVRKWSRFVKIQWVQLKTGNWHFLGIL